MSREIEQEGIVVCISGPSGVGKGTVIEAVKDKIPDFKLSISMTTRKPRGQEQHGVEYYFCEKEEFEDLIQKKEILEFDIYNNQYYGTPVGPIRDYMKENQDVMMDITLAGALQVKKILPKTIMIFLMPPNMQILEERLRGRQTESGDAINARMVQARYEIKQADKFEYVLVNGDLDETVNRLLAIISAEKSKYVRQKEIIRQIVEQI